MKAWKKGFVVGVVIGILGSLVTYITGDISPISIPLVLLFSLFGAGLLFISHNFELATVVSVYGLIGAIIGYLFGSNK
jgi:hypothetical protein